MAGYKLTKAADSDLKEIARYTVAKWGVNQALIYSAKLQNYFSEIGEGKIIGKVYDQELPEVKVTRCEKHFIFYLNQPACVLIIAVYHGRMEMMSRLKRRLVKIL